MRQQALRDKLTGHSQCICRHGGDMPEIGAGPRVRNDIAALAAGALRARTVTEAALNA